MAYGGVCYFVYLGKKMSTFVVVAIIDFNIVMVDFFMILLKDFLKIKNICARLVNEYKKLACKAGGNF